MLTGYHIAIDPGTGTNKTTNKNEITKGMNKMKKIKLFATPKRTVITCAGIAAILAVVGTGSAFAAGVVAESTAIGKTAAEKAAFSDAGVTASDVAVTRTEFDFERGKFVYEVDFISDGREYEYTLDANTGAVIKKETEGKENNAQQGTVTAAISLDEAKEIALADANVAAADVTFTKEKTDRDDGRYEYDLEFVTATHEYEYEISAATGNITDKSVDAIRQSGTASVPNTAPDPAPAPDTSSPETPPEPAPDSSVEPAPAPAPTPDNTASVSDSELITLAQAKEKALADAGIAAADASFTKEKLDRDDGVYHYEVEFVSGGKKYEYDVNAANGAVLKKEVETVKQTQTTPAEPEILTLAQAKEKALADADVAAADATFTKEKMDRDDGRYVYEIDFTTDSARYDYEIDAATGNVLDKDVEITKKPVTEQTGSATTYIGADKAKEAALAHAGLSANDVTFTKAKADHDDGRHVYEIEFFKGYVEYEYEIDAITGAVLDFEKDVDD